jgi:LytTR family transcriptional regulator, CO-responsive transcriptional regulator RcoM
MSQQQYILNRLPIGLVMLDRECHVVSFSGAAGAVFGAERLRESLGKTIQSVHPEHSHSKIEWLLEQSRHEDASGYASMLINVPDTVLQLRMIQLHDADGVSGYCLILYDITDLTSHPATGAAAATGSPPGRHLFKLPVSMQGSIALLDIDEVVFLRAEGHHTQVCAGGKHYFCSMSLSQLESRLPQDRFLRVHRSYVINLAHACAVLRHDDQFEISMAGSAEEKIPVSRINVPRLRELLGV